MDTHKRISSKTIYKNSFLEVKVDTVTNNGNQWEQVYFTKPAKNAAGVLPLDKKGVYLVNQYRYASGRFLWQLPMGMIDKGRTKIQTAKNELKEEAGITAKKYTLLGSFIIEPGMSPQKLFVYSAEGLKEVDNNPQYTEVGMKRKHFTFGKLRRMIKTGELKCGITLSSLMLLNSNFPKINITNNR
jgi:ADP-ribose pyrophosphatase YjhB (NUDIX family)